MVFENFNIRYVILVVLQQIRPRYNSSTTSKVFQVNIYGFLNLCLKGCFTFFTLFELELVGLNFGLYSFGFSRTIILLYCGSLHELIMHVLRILSGPWTHRIKSLISHPLLIILLHLRRRQIMVLKRLFLLALIFISSSWNRGRMVLRLWSFFVSCRHFCMIILFWTYISKLLPIKLSYI